MPTFRPGVDAAGAMLVSVPAYEPPVTQWAKTVDDLSIAWTSLGDGPVDLIVAPGWISHLDATWELPRYRRFFEHNARYSRVITFDKRGTGMSDRPANVPSLEERMDDLRAVMDAARSESAYVVGWFEATPMCVLFAATYPDRVRGVILGSPFARWLQDVEGGDELLRLAVETIEETWGTGATLAEHSPTAAADPEFARWWARYERLSSTPKNAGALMLMQAGVDVTDVLPTVKQPVLVIHREGDLTVSSALSREVADALPDARYLEVPGVDALPYVGDSGPILNAIEEFVTGHRARPAAEENRILATVLFTDIVGSTERAAAMGDSRWRSLLDDHDERVRRTVDDFSGRVIKTTGDGALATFDGPARGVRCAAAVCEAMAPLGVDIRAGLHTGEVELRGDDVGGLAVHIGARVGALAHASEVLVSRTVKDLVVGSGIVFEDRGVHRLKGVPDEWQLYAVSGT